MKRAAQIFALAGLALLLAYSFAGNSSSNREALRFLMEPDSSGVWADITSRFNRQFPGRPIEMVQGPPETGTREDMYATAFLGGESAYDIVYADTIWIPKFAAAGWLADLTDRITQDQRANMLPADFTAGTYQGKLYRLPVSPDAGMLYYRADLIEEPPQTFDDLDRIAATVTAQDQIPWGFVWQGKQYEGLVCDFLEVLWGYGGDWIDSDTREVRIDEPASIQAIEFLKRTIGTISPPAVTTYTEEESRAIFFTNNAAFLRNWTYVWQLAKQSDTAIRDEIAVAPMVHAPGQSSYATLGGTGFAISAFTADPDRAWQFIAFATNEENQRLLQERRGRIPARRNLIPPQFLPILEDARPRPMIPEYAAASDILQYWLSAALVGEVDPETAMRETARETRALLGPPLTAEQRTGALARPGAPLPDNDAARRHSLDLALRARDPAAGTGGDLSHPADPPAEL